MPLTPEQKMAIIAEIQNRPDTTAEQRQRLGRLWTKTLESTEQGLIPQDPIQSITKGAEAAGMVTAEKMAEGGANPYLSAAVGTGVSMAPDMVMGMKGIKPSVGVTEDAIAIGKAALRPGKAAAQEAEMLAAETALKELPVKYANKAQMLKDLSQQAGKELETAQGARGIGMVKQGVPNLPKDLTEFANSMKGIAGKTPDELASAMDLKGLQGLKDTITVARQSGKLSKVEKAMVNKAAEKIDGAIAKQAPEIGESLDKVREVHDAQNALKNDKIVEKMRLQRALEKIRSDKRLSKSSKATRIAQLLVKGIGIGAGGTATYKWLD